MRNLVSLIVVFVLIFSPFISNAQVEGTVVRPVGGPILDVFPCTCDPNTFYLLVYDYTTMLPTPLVFIVGESRLNAYYNPWIPFNHILGTYFVNPAPLCYMLIEKKGVEYCKPKVTVGVITPPPFSGIGTTGIPPF